MVDLNGDIQFLHPSGQIFCASGDLTLRPDSSETRSVIIGSGANLRPEVDIVTELGTPESRWYGVNTGRLTALSGTLSGPFGQLTWQQNGFDFNSTTVNLTSAQLDLISNSVMNIEGASELNSDGIVRFSSSSAPFEMDTLMHPSVDNLGIIGQTARRFARIHGTSGIFNMLGAPSSGTSIDVIADLIPETDSTYALGTTGRRWSNLFADNATIPTFNSTTITAANITATAALASFGTFGVLGLATFNGGTFFGNDAAPSQDAVTHFGLQGFRWRQIYMVSGQIETIVPRTSGSFTTMHGSFIPGLDCEWSLGFDSNRWGSIHGCSGVFNILSPQVSGTHIQVNGSLSPSKDALYLLGGGAGSDAGGDPARWSNILAASGQFNAIYPPVSGTGIGGNPDVWIEVGGSLVPPAHTGQSGPYWLGAGKFNRWQGVNAASGSFDDMSASTSEILTLDTRTVNLLNPTDFINAGTFDWDLGASTGTISNGTWVFDNTVDVEFDKRPTTNASGMAMEAENYFEVYCGRNVSFANPATIMSLYTSSNGAVLTPHDYYFFVNEDVQIRNYTIQTTHLGASPAPWAVRLRVDDAGVDHASGIFTFGPTANVVAEHFGTLSGTQTIPAGSRCRIIVDSDGGAGHNTVFAKMWMGFTVVSGLQRGPQED